MTRPLTVVRTLVIAGCLLGPATAAAQRVPVRDLVVDDQGVPLRLVGYGLVTGLAGTGDIAYTGRNAQHTVQSVANLLRRFDIIVPPELLRTRNVAAVLVTAEVSPWLRPGGRFDVHVSSVGDARSLRDGVLWMTPLVAEVGGAAMGTAQGALLIEDGDLVRRRVGWTGASGRIVGGGVVEAELPRPAFASATRLILRTPDIGTAARIAATIDSVVGKETAKVEDPGAITLTIPDSAGGPAMALERIRNLTVELRRPARIVIDQRNGTVVAGGDLTLGPGLVSVGGISLSVGGAPADTIAAAAASPTGLRMPTGATVQQLAAALHAVRTPPQLVAQVFEALRTVGALSAEVVAR
ncbi:MAG: flagellar basal body P-ring protein FlgI [Gemmatimonadetes bacterium]|nr:flagellar basal body P-ring protein FlgI [Gemmatimonadota bacterium]